MLRRAAMRFHFWFTDHEAQVDRNVHRAGRFLLVVRALGRWLP